MKYTHLPKKIYTVVQFTLGSALMIGVCGEAELAFLAVVLVESVFSAGFSLGSAPASLGGKMTMAGPEPAVALALEAFAPSPSAGPSADADAEEASWWRSAEAESTRDTTPMVTESGRLQAL